jgi:hypothetical protein
MAYLIDHHPKSDFCTFIDYCINGLLSTTIAEYVVVVVVVGRGLKRC